MSRSKSKFPCLSYGKNVSGGPAIACDSCNSWCHGNEVCSGLSNVLIKLIVSQGGKQVKYLCTTCEGKHDAFAPPTPQSSPATQSSALNSNDISSFGAAVADLTSTVKDLAITVATLNGGLNEVKTELADIRGEVNNIKAIVDSIGDVANSQTRASIREEVRELHEREKRRESIILRGFNVEDVVEKVNEISEFLCPNISRIILSDIVPLKSKLIRAKILNSVHRRELLINAKKLANSPFSAYYITRDLTYNQRLELKNRRSMYRLNNNNNVSNPGESTGFIASTSQSQFLPFLSGANALPVSASPSTSIASSSPNLPPLSTNTLPQTPVFTGGHSSNAPESASPGVSSKINSSKNV